MDERMGHEMLVARLREVERDAKRYRWIAHQINHGQDVQVWIGLGAERMMPMRSAYEMDETVDAAIKEEEARKEAA